MSFAMGQRVVFSALYNETDEFLVIFIRNFLLHTGVGEFLIINLPPGRQVHCPIADESDRVFLVSGRTKRQKLGHTLLVGHLEAFDHATEVVGTFEFFCPLASNSMFARQFNLAAATDKLTSSHHEARVSLEVLPSVWWWEKLRRNPSAISFLQAVWGLTHARGAQIEGLFASQRDWELLRQRHSQIVDFGETLTSDTMIPLEEILPATFFCNFGSGNYIHICHNFWNRGPRSPVRLDEIVDISRNLPQEVCLLKWFERDPNHPSTAAVSVGWARDLLSEISNAKKEERAGANLTHRILLEQLSVMLRKEEGFVPLTTRWWTESELSTDTARLVFEQPIRMQRQIVNLLPPLVAGGGNRQPFSLPKEQITCCI